MLDCLDVVAAKPEHHEVLLEHDQIRVLETPWKPGEETPVHLEPERMRLTQVQLPSSAPFASSAVR